MKITILCLVVVCLFGVFNVALADDDGAKKAVADAVQKVEAGFSSATVSGGADPAAKTQELIGNMIKIFLGIVGTIALLVFLYSGIMWMLAGGKEAFVQKAESSMIWAALGLFVVFISYTIITYLIEKFRF